MLRAIYERFKRFLSWLNGEGRSVNDAVREAESHRRDIDDRTDSSRGGGLGI